MCKNYTLYALFYFRRRKKKHLSTPSYYDSSMPCAKQSIILAPIMLDALKAGLRVHSLCKNRLKPVASGKNNMAFGV